MFTLFLASVLAAPPTTYADGYKEAIKTGKPLVVWVGQKAKRSPGIDIEVKELEGAKPPCVVISQKKGDKLMRLADLPGTPTANSIQKVIYSQRGRSSMKKTAKLGVEQLEDRLTMSCVPPPLPPAAVQTMLSEQVSAMDLVPLDKVTDEALGGNWSDATSWKSGKLPAKGSNVYIPMGITEVYDLDKSEAYNSIRVDGVLTFVQSKSTSLLVQTIVNMPGGDVEIVEADPKITTTITFVDSGPLDLIGDPKELGRGYIAVGNMNSDGTMGAMATTNIVGAKKDGWQSIPGINKGGTSLSLQALPNGWSIGDRILFNGTGANSQDETVSISGINGNTISFAALQYDHLAPTAHNGPLTTTVANLTRNIVFSSQNPSPLRAGHIMFMHTDQSTINYASMVDLGRTDKSKALGATTTDTNGQVMTNVAGRYALHFHRLYNFGVSCAVSPTGDVVTGGSGWGYDNHSSNIAFSDCVDFNTFGAGFVCEAGDEIGSFMHCLSVHNVGKNVNFKKAGTGETAGTGDRGFGWWIQGKYGVAIEDCVAAESGMSGYWFNHTGLTQGGGFGLTPFWTMNITDPALIPPNKPVSVNTVTLPFVDFKRNQFQFGNEAVWIMGNPDRGNDLIEDFKGWGCVKIGIERYYEGTGHFDKVVLLGLPGSENGIQATFGYSSSQECSDLDIEGFNHGVEIAGKGTNVVNNAGYLDNKTNFYIQVNDTGGNGGSTTIQGSDPVFGNASSVPGGYNYDFWNLQAGNFGHNVDQLDGANFRAWAAFMDTPKYPKKQIYMKTQAWDSSPWISSDATLNDPHIPIHFSEFQMTAFSEEDKALTNGEMWTKYGRTVGGYAAPADAVDLPQSNVIIGSRQSPIPNWKFRNAPRITNQPKDYVLKIEDETGAAKSFPPVDLHEGWNFLPQDHHGFHYSMMVFLDTQPPVLTLLDPPQSVTTAGLSDPFTVRWFKQENSIDGLAHSQSRAYPNLLAFPVQTKPDGSQSITVPITATDSATNSTSIGVPITVTP